jgi:2,4-dienoyl-CoA reductase-like NADH-dependent reductase (Old Yellow Enzyme family)
MFVHVPVGQHGQSQAEISAADIDEVIQSFVDSALRAVRIAGFDGIEIHGANGYLLDQFLTAYSNRRTDRWGGDVHGRVSLLAEVVKAVKAAVGNEVPVGTAWWRWRGATPRR